MTGSAGSRRACLVHERNTPDLEKAPGTTGVQCHRKNRNRRRRPSGRRAPSPDLGEAGCREGRTGLRQFPGKGPDGPVTQTWNSEHEAHPRAPGRHSGCTHASFVPKTRGRRRGSPVPPRPWGPGMESLSRGLLPHTKGQSYTWFSVGSGASCGHGARWSPWNSRAWPPGVRRLLGRPAEQELGEGWAGGQTAHWGG